MERARAWAEAKVAEISRVAVEDRDKAESEAAERANAWAEAMAKDKAEISRLTAKG